MSEPQDAASLDRLVDIVEPDPAGVWWPLAPGLAAIIVAVFAWLTIWLILRGLRYRANRYRREATGLLNGANSVVEVNQILKRAAMAVWPREDVASLSGPAWIEFLNQSLSGAEIDGRVASALADDGYRRQESDSAGSNEIVVQEAIRWVHGHHP